MSKKNTARNTGSVKQRSSITELAKDGVYRTVNNNGYSAAESEAIRRQRAANERNKKLIKAGTIATAAVMTGGAAGLFGGGAGATGAVPGAVSGAPITAASQAAAFGVPTVGGATGAAAAVLPSTSMAAAMAPYAVNPYSVAGGTGSSGAMLGNLNKVAPTGNRMSMTNLLKLGEMGVNVGSQIWAQRSQSKSDAAALAAQIKQAEAMLALEREAAAREAAELDRFNKEEQRRYDATQEQERQDRELERAMWEDTEARRAPYREAGYNAMSHLSGINGMPIPARPVPRTMPMPGAATPTLPVAGNGTRGPVSGPMTGGTDGAWPDEFYEIDPVTGKRRLKYDIRTMSGQTAPMTPVLSDLTQYRGTS